MLMTLLGREQPDLPATELFTTIELTVLRTFSKRNNLKPPEIFGPRPSASRAVWEGTKGARTIRLRAIWRSGEGMAGSKTSVEASNSTVG
jgi:hypothetical protein